MKKIFTLLLGIGITALSTISYTFAYTQEQQQAYQWAYKYGITTQPTIEAANVNGSVTRQALAKMIVNYLQNLAGVEAVDICMFPDIEKVTVDLRFYTQLVCGLNIMGSDGQNFNPTQPVTRAQIGTVLSRILWGDTYNYSGKGYYVYHLNALQHNGIMNNIDNPTASNVKRGDVFIMFKRIYEKFGSSVYLNNPNQTSAYEQTQPTTSDNYSDFSYVDTQTENYSYYDEDDYNSVENTNGNVIYTGKNGTRYYYNTEFLKILKTTAEKKGESDLAKYLDIEIKYKETEPEIEFDPDEFARKLGIDIDSDDLTKKQKQEIATMFGMWVDNLVQDIKKINGQYDKNLKSIVNNIKKDKFSLNEKYNKTKNHLEVSNEYLDNYGAVMSELMTISLTAEDDNSEEGLGIVFSLLGLSFSLKSETDSFNEFNDLWAKNTIELLGGELIN